MTWFFSSPPSLPPVTMVLHGANNLDISGNVGASNKGRKLALGEVIVLLGRVEAVPEAPLHDSGKFLVNLLRGPRSTLRVLSHLKTGNGDTTTVCGLSGPVPETSCRGINISWAENYHVAWVLLTGLSLLPVSLIDINSFLGRSHV